MLTGTKKSNDVFGRERQKNLALALLLSAGVHLIAMTTLDLSPGSWRHGVRPALRVELRSVSAEQIAGEARAERGKREPREPRRAERQQSGLSAATVQEGSSLPVGERYYRNSEVDVAATPIERGPLVIPELAYLSRLQGTVRARVFINEDGTVASVQVVEVKPRGGIFEEAALEALRQVRYKPAQIAGQPVKTQKLIEVSFNPYEEQAPSAK